MQSLLLSCSRLPVNRAPYFRADAPVEVDPDGEGGFDEALIDSVDGDKVSVKVGWEPKTFKSAQCMQINPPKMEKFEKVFKNRLKK